MIQSSTKRRQRFAYKANFIREDRANIAPIFALLMVPIIGVLGVATEASSWYLAQGSMQNAADAAALAAASNVTSTGTVTDCAAAGDPCYEARAVAARYGFVNGQKNVSVYAKSNVACPAPATTSDCYQVAISKPFPIRLLAVTGFKGDTTINSRHYQTVSAGAVSQTGGAGTSGCILALSSNADYAVDLKNNAELKDTNCGVYSNSSSSSAIRVANNAKIAGPTYAVGGVSKANNGELNGTPNKTGVTAMPDPYSDVAYPTSSALSAMPCYSGTYSKENGGTLNLNPGRYCNGINAKNNVTVNMTSGVYYVESGFSLKNNVTVNATPSAGVTIIVAGAYALDFGNNITFNINAQSTGTYAGIAFMGPRNGTVSTNHIFENNGANTFNGAIYFPSQMVSFSNNAGLSSPGCVQIVASKIYFQNNAFISSNCSGTGVRTIGAGARYVKLVQ